MSWLVITAATIAILIVAALAIPVRLDVRFELAEGLRGAARLRWLFGLIDVALDSGRTAAAQPDRGERAKSPIERHTVRAPRRRPKVVAVLRTRGLLRRLVRLAEDTFHVVRVHHAVVRARFGFDDPADTGRACGAILPIIAMASSKGADVRCTPDFAGAILCGSCTGTLSVTPLRVVGAVLVFAGSPTVWRAFRVWRAAS
jgi:hypothetical protein